MAHRHISLLMKPVSGLCNMRCAYCFYADEAAHREQAMMGLMSQETAVSLIDAAFAAAGRTGSVTFSFQGGEPTLAGLDFYRTFVREAQVRNVQRLPVTWSIQTNGLTLDEVWADFFHEHSFLVGISVDGEPATHDAFRLDAEGQGTYQRVADHIALLLRKGVATNLLCVVNARTAARPRRVYRWLKGLSSRYVQFIPCLDPLDADTAPLPWTLRPEAYADFLREVFDEWYRDWRKGQYISVRQFEDWVCQAMGMPGSSCASCGSCGSYLVAEADGSLYPCDFYVLDDWRLGNCREGLEAALNSDVMHGFTRRALSKPTACTTCPYYSVCRGGCPREWRQTDKATENRLCPAFQSFFRYAMPRIREIAAAERQARMGLGSL